MIKLKYSKPVAAAAAAALMSLASSSAMATIVCDTPPFGPAQPFTVPVTVDGVYVNFVTGAFGVTVPTRPPGWDFNPYSNGGNFNFFWSTGAANITVGMLTAGVHAASVAGVVVGPASTFGAGGSATATQMAPWRAGVTNRYIGIRFNNEGAALTNYGWARMTTTGPTTGFPATVSQFCYQNDGTAILTGDTGLPAADLRMTKTDGATTEVPGTQVTYTLTAENFGPTAVIGATVTDTFPASLSGCLWSCAGLAPNPGTCTAGSTGNINDSAVNLPAPPAGQSSAVQYTATCNINAAATGNLVNTASISSTTTSDPSPANATSIDTDTLTPQYDYSITKTDSATNEVPGTSVAYTITATWVSGPSAPPGLVTDTFPGTLTGCVWACTGTNASCTANSSGNISDTVNFTSVGGTAVYTATCNINPGATGSLANTATIAAAAGDTDASNNSATDTDTLQPEGNLSISKDDFSATEVPGTTVTYTIVAANSGPSLATGVTVTDNFPAELSGCSTTCVAAGTGSSCTAGPTLGNINDTANLSPGGSATYTATCNVVATATGNLVNTATLTAPAGFTDTTPGNNSATDTDTLTPQYDLSITKTDGAGVDSEIPGTSVTYTITATWVSGPSTPPASLVSDAFPSALNNCARTCTGIGASCTGGPGNISDPVTFTSIGGTAVYTATCLIDPDATGSLVNTATIAAGGDTDTANNTATDTDTLTPQANLSITKTDGQTSVAPGAALVYTIVASSAGPSSTTATVLDTLPSSLTACTWTCASTNGGACGASGSGSLLETVTLDRDGIGTGPFEGGPPTATFTVSCTVAASASGSIVNTAQIATQGAVVDPDNSNNSATDTNTVARSADAGITKDDGQTTATPGGSVTYTLVASNAGPQSTGATVTDTFPASLSACTWTCVGTLGATCPASGAGNISAAVQLPMGGLATFTATCQISVTATGTLANTATIAVTDVGTTDSVPGNDSATDTDTLGGGSANLGISVTDNREFVQVGEALNTIITVSNAGPSNSPTNTVSSTLPVELSGGTWSCIPFGGATCAAGSGSTLSDTPNLPNGSQVSYVWTTTVLPGSPDDLFAVTATVAAGGTVTDPTPANNTGTDVPGDIIVIFKDGFDGPVTGILDGFTDASGYAQASLRLDAGLLAALDFVPTVIASGERAQGGSLFRIELARFDTDMVLRLVMRDGQGVEKPGAWQVVALENRLIDFAWQPASATVADGYLRVTVEGVATSMTQRAERDGLARLRVPLNQGMPTLRPAN